MANESPPDPAATFRELVTTWERNLNSVANQVMGTESFSRLMQEGQRLQLALQQATSEAMGRRLAAMNMPTREDIIRLAEKLTEVDRRLARIEASLDGDATVVPDEPAACCETTHTTTASGLSRTRRNRDDEYRSSPRRHRLARAGDGRARDQRGVKGFQYATSGPAKVGLTPKTTLYGRGTLQLYHYKPQVDELYRVPVLMVMATTNKAFVFDLLPGQSMVEFLLKRGFDVFVIDWNAPAPEERGLTLEDYTQDFIPTCIRKVQQETGQRDISVIGYCMGGVLSLIYAATHTDGPLKNLVCLTTPVDWKQMGLTTMWNDPRYFDVDQVADTLGVVPADFIRQMFEMQKPAQRLAGQLRVSEQMWNDEFVRSYRAFERWGDETLPLAGEYLRQTTKELSWGNKLFTGELVVGGRDAKLSNIKAPILSVVAEHDHLAPRDATKPLLDLVGSNDKEEILLKGGHVSLIAGPNAIGRMWPRLERWLAVRST